MPLQFEFNSLCLPLRISGQLAEKAYELVVIESRAVEHSSECFIGMPHFVGVVIFTVYRFEMIALRISQ